MLLNEKIKPFLVLILLLNEIRLRFLNCAGSYKKLGVLIQTNEKYLPTQ